MAASNRTGVIPVLLSAVALFSACVTQQAAIRAHELSPRLKATTDLTGKTVLLPPSAPDRSKLTRVGYFTINNGAELEGIIVVYSCDQSKQRVTYMELYDPAGRLFLIEWVNEQSGVTEVAIDFGILNGNGSDPVGVLGIVAVGDPT